VVVLELGYYLTQVAIDRLSLSRQLRQLAPFGQEKAEGKLRDVFELKVHHVNGGESVKMEAYGVENISQVRNEHIESKKHDYAHLKGL
jgi:hypothetical protein